ncbi:hypothetical protein [Dankookia sp. P2]|uniref:hypothetical protein n=1 Tax=Dankookia sp. P2 TaxID=3423955 RepID=UPI003D66A0FB
MPDEPGAPAPFGPPPLLALLQMGGPAGLSAEGENWLLDLGQVEAGSLLRTFGFAVLNNAAPPADALNVRFELQGDPEMRFFLPEAFTDIGPRSRGARSMRCSPRRRPACTRRG